MAYIDLKVILDLMETNSIKKSVNIKTSVDDAWNKLSKISDLEWLQGQNSSKINSKKKRGVGTVRLISFEDGSVVEEHITGWSPKKYFSYVATSGLPLDAYHATISIDAIQGFTKITWESYFSSKCSEKEFKEFSSFLSVFYVKSLKNLKHDLEK